jgi:hypothetical protein
MVVRVTDLVEPECLALPENASTQLFFHVITL